MDKSTNNTCILVQEMLPIYFEDCVSAACKDVIEEHVKECKACQDRLEKIRTDAKTDEVSLDELLQSETEEKQKFANISKRLKRRRLKNLILAVGVICILFIAYTNCFVNTITTSNSMSPTINEMEGCMIFRHAYTFTKPQKDDIIAVNLSMGLHMKRVVGIPGDTIEIKDGNLYVNGEVNDFYAGIEAPTEYYSITVAENTYFLLGDNFEHSYDSRAYGCVKLEDIYGKCIFHGNMLNNPFHRYVVTRSTSDIE